VSCRRRRRCPRDPRLRRPGAVSPGSWRVLRWHSVPGNGVWWLRRAGRLTGVFLPAAGVTAGYSS